MSEIKRWFVPLPDITPYELAIIMIKSDPRASFQNGCIFTAEQWLELPKGVKRHFHLVKVPLIDPE